MNGENTVSFRLNNDQLDILSVLSDIDGITLADEIRRAVEDYITSKASEKDKILAKIKEAKEKRDLRERKLLDRLNNP